ncbi:MAG: aminomethyltransferase family protein [Candidatus Competibacteraceae bacterium]|nr:aminomethyltransferase family protein [Candidatus Competibacteraceae bacterium]
MLGRLSQVAAFYGKRNSVGWRDGCAVCPVYRSVETEYQKLRQGVTLTDCSHFGHFRLEGPDALRLIDRLSFADPHRLAADRLLPSYALHEDGSLFFEMLVADAGDSYRLMTEGVDPLEVAALLHRLAASRSFEVAIVDETQTQSFIGLNGPYAWELLKDVIGPGVIGLRPLESLSGNQLDGILFALHRVDKAGEYGYLLQVDSDYLIDLWQQLLQVGRRFDIEPVGYEALDLCKLENRLTNIHREARLANHVLELNTRALMRRDRREYLGRAAVEKALSEGVKRRLVGMVLEGERTAQPPLGAGAGVHADGVRVGDIAHLAFSFALGRWLALAFLEADYAYAGLRYRIGDRRGDAGARTVSAPFIVSESLRIRPRQDSYFERGARARLQDGERAFPPKSASVRPHRFQGVLTDRRAYRRTIA